MSPPLLEVTNLTKDYPVATGLSGRARGCVRAVDQLSFALARGQTLALVGESGSGKSTVARCLTRLTPPSGGQIRFEDRDVSSLHGRALRAYRRQIPLVFQDPSSSLNPRMTAEALIAEPLWAHRLATRTTARTRARELLELVGIGPTHARRLPHELSGGQRQRIAIARALGLEPKLLILDEPVASLDKSIAAQILNLLLDLQEQLGIAYLVISHDLSLVRHVAHDVIVMYLGTAMETADVERLFTGPRHPYTQALLSSVAIPDPELERTRTRIPLWGEIPKSLDRPTGCRFHPRCFKAEATCVDREPPLEPSAPGHRAACWLAAPAEIL